MRRVECGFEKKVCINKCLHVAEVVYLNILLGQVVYSKSGRDAGKRFIITEIVDDMYVKISDGDLKKKKKPKKKKIKHLKLTEAMIESVNCKLTTDLKVTNAEIRKALAVADNTKDISGQLDI